MGYLIGEIWLWLIVAYVIGLAAGWLLWGLRRRGRQSRIAELEEGIASANAQAREREAEHAELASTAASAEAEIARLNVRIAELEEEKEKGSAGNG